MKIAAFRAGTRLGKGAAPTLSCPRRKISNLRFSSHFCNCTSSFPFLASFPRVPAPPFEKEIKGSTSTRPPLAKASPMHRINIDNITVITADIQVYIEKRLFLYLQDETIWVGRTCVWDADYAERLLSRSLCRLLP